MKIRSLTLIIAVIALLATPAMAGTIINFDGLPTTQIWGSVYGWDDIPLIYAGFNWVGWEVISQPAYAAFYHDNTPFPSGPNFAYPGNESEGLQISSANPFQFIGADFASWPNANGTIPSVTITGYLGGNLVGSALTVPFNTTWTLSGGITGPVDTLKFTPTTGYFRMDNFQYDAATPVPEPATCSLLGGGLVLLGGFGIWRRKKAVQIS